MRLVLLFISSLILFSCNKHQDKEFQLLYKSFQNEMTSTPLLRAFLEQKLYFDSMAISADPQTVEHTLAFAKDNLNQLHNIQIDRLDESLHNHYNNLHSFLDIILNNIETKKIHQTRPSFYAPESFLKSLGSKSDLKAIQKGLTSVSNNFQMAILSLQDVSKDSLESSIEISTGCFQYLSQILQPHIQSIEDTNENEKAALYELTKAKLMLKDYVGFGNSLIFEKSDAALVKLPINSVQD